MKKKSTAKTFLINVGIFIGFLIILNFFVISVWETRRFVNFAKEDVFKKKIENIDSRVQLPNYENVSWAKEYFKDFNTLKDDNYKSYIGWRKTAFNSKYINIDSLGERITPQTVSKSDSVIKVVFLGGSTMWGTGASDDKTIPALFAKEGAGKYQVENFGESGYRAMQSYIYLMLNFNKGLKTDWVISYDGVNEAVGFIENNEPISTYAESRMRQKLQRKDGPSKVVNDLTYKNFFLGPIINTISRVKSKNVIVTKQQVELSDKRADRVARSLLDAWNEMNDISEKNNANFLAVLQPNAAVGSPNVSYLKFDEYEGLLMSTYDQLYSHVRKLLQSEEKYYKLNEKFLDLTNSFDGNEKYYIDWSHVTPNGNQVVQQEILKHIQQQN